MGINPEVTAVLSQEYLNSVSKISHARGLFNSPKWPLYALNHRHFLKSENDYLAACGGDRNRNDPPPPPLRASSPRRQLLIQMKPFYTVPGLCRINIVFFIKSRPCDWPAGSRPGLPAKVGRCYIGAQRAPLTPREVPSIFPEVNSVAA
jgi:hypothetical protein